MYYSSGNYEAFVRPRKQASDGDFQRNRNQQAVLKGIADKLISADTLTDPRKLAEQAQQSVIATVTKPPVLAAAAGVEISA